MTKKLLAVLFVVAMSTLGFAQASANAVGACNGSPVTGTAWNNATSLNTTQVLLGPTSAQAATVVLDQTTTITGGAVTFQGDYGDGNFVSIEAWRLSTPATPALIGNPYTLVASTNQPFFVNMTGVYRLQLKLTTSFTGTGAVTPFTTAWCNTPPLLPIDNRSLVGTTIDTNSGSKSAGTQRIVVATDQPNLTTPLNTNTAQINGVATTMGNGVSGTGVQRVTIASDSTGQVALAAGTNSVGESPNMATATTTNAASACWFTSAASTNSTNCKNGSGNLYSVLLINTTATLYYLRIYNTSTAPTCSSATGFLQSIPVPASATGAGFSFTPAVPIGFSTGISFCFTGGSGSTDNSNAATGVFGVLEYK